MDQADKMSVIYRKDNRENLMIHANVMAVMHETL
jgi:hypothetical protein